MGRARVSPACLPQGPGPATKGHTLPGPGQQPPPARCINQCQDDGYTPAQSHATPPCPAVTPAQGPGAFPAQPPPLGGGIQGAWRAPGHPLIAHSLTSLVNPHLEHLSYSLHITLKSIYLMCVCVLLEEERARPADRVLGFPRVTVYRLLVGLSQPATHNAQHQIPLHSHSRN